MIGPFRYYLFDIDGTLVDSALDICGAIREVLSGTEQADVPFEFLRGYIGRHLIDLFADLFPDAPPARLDHFRSSVSRSLPADPVCSNGHRAAHARDVGL